MVGDNVFNEAYVIENIRRSIMRIKGRIYARVADMELEIFTSKEPLTFQNRREGEYRRVAPGDHLRMAAGDVRERRCERERACQAGSGG